MIVLDPINRDNNTNTIRLDMWTVDWGTAGQIQIKFRA